MPTTIQHVMYALRLDLACFDPAPFEVTRRHLDDQGIRLTTLAHELSLDADAVQRAYTVHNECRKRQPPVELRQTRIPFEVWAADFVDEQGETALPGVYCIAKHRQRYIGVSAALRLPGVPDTLYAGFTGVTPAYGERGIGVGLKLETIRYAVAQGYRAIETEVLAINIPMVRINEALGFRRHGERIIEYTY